MGYPRVRRRSNKYKKYVIHHITSENFDYISSIHIEGKLFQLVGLIVGSIYHFVCKYVPNQNFFFQKMPFIFIKLLLGEYIVCIHCRMAPKSFRILRQMFMLLYLA